MNIQIIKEKAMKLLVENKKTVIIVSCIVVLIIVALTVINSFKTNSEVLTLNSARSKLDVSATSKPIGDGDYDYTEAVDHIGEKATVTGTVQSVFTSKSGTVFFDFCDNFQTCTFSAVIFASNVPKFKDLMQYEREVKLTGLIKSYQGKAEIILNGPEQIE
ncbi:MAG: OB-fold nucleic acid binding domain-containing protein [Candidatus Taylorbacteria bacterium]